MTTFVHTIRKNIMENPFAQIEQKLDGIEDLLLTLIARIDQIELPDTDTIGDIDDCAGWIKKSSSTIYKYVSEKKIPHIKNGKKVLFNKKHIMMWLNAGTRTTISEMQAEVDHGLKKLITKRDKA